MRVRISVKPLVSDRFDKQAWASEKRPINPCNYGLIKSVIRLMINKG